MILYFMHFFKQLSSIVQDSIFYNYAKHLDEFINSNN